MKLECVGLRSLTDKLLKMNKINQTFKVLVRCTSLHKHRADTLSHLRRVKTREAIKILISIYFMISVLSHIYNVL
jgi:hypothetical protein